MNMSLLIPKGDTLITYYMLPLVNVNKHTFARGFKTSYINDIGTTLYVELNKPMISPTYKLSSYYLSETLIKDTLFIVFKIPDRFLDDGNKFINGLYSQMSREAKKLIYSTSTLPYNVKMDTFAMSHPILQALTKTKSLRKFLLEYLGVEVLADSGELIEEPDKSWFIEHRIKQL